MTKEMQEHVLVEQSVKIEQPWLSGKRDQFLYSMSSPEQELECCYTVPPASHRQ